MMKNYKSLLAGALLLATLSSAAFADSFNLTIGTPPPAPVVEAIPVAPGPDYVWRPGYWRWVDERHVWIPGHYAQPPHPHAVWEAPRWDHHEDGYHFQEGHWK